VTPSGSRGPAAAIPPVVEGALRLASELRRSPHDNGVEKLLTPRETDRLRAACRTMPLARLSDIADLLRSLDGPAAGVTRSLLLRAVSARARVFERADDGAAGSALQTLAAFRDKLQDLDAEEALRRASVLDLDETDNASALDAQALWEKRGVTSDRGGDDEQSDNDGLFQRFTGSCGPTTLQMMLAEADPIVAFAIHESGLCSDAADDAVADYQRLHLEAHGGIAIGRREAHLRARLRNALGRLKRSGDVDEGMAASLLRHALEQGPLDDAGGRALSALRAEYAGFPDDDALARLRSRLWPEVDEGIPPDALAQLLDEELTPLTGVRYRQTRPADGFARGQAWRHIDDVARALRRGVDVPFGIVEPGHWMMISAVKGRKPKRQFLVADPDGGRSAWVGERSLVRGTFADEQFHLSSEGERPYVDCFFLPEEPS
jgi:hypothetical protein